MSGVAYSCRNTVEPETASIPIHHGSEKFFPLQHVSPVTRFTQKNETRLVDVSRSSPIKYPSDDGTMRQRMPVAEYDQEDFEGSDSFFENHRTVQSLKFSHKIIISYLNIKTFLRCWNKLRKGKSGIQKDSLRISVILRNAFAR